MNIVESLGGTAQGRKLSIYVPSKDKDGRTIDHQRWRNETMSFLTKSFGRCTAMPRLEGTWADPASGEVLHETTDIVYSFVEEKSLREHAERVRSFLTYLGRETFQAEVGFEYDGQFFTIRLDGNASGQC
jgi:hypothetical protein